MRTQRKSGTNARLKCIRANIKSLSLWLVSGGYIDVTWAPQGLGTPSCGFTGARKPISWANYCLKISLENSHVSGISNDSLWGRVWFVLPEHRMLSLTCAVVWIRMASPFWVTYLKTRSQMVELFGKSRSCALVGERVSLGVDAEV